MIYIESPSNNPRFNLALEQYVFESMDSSLRYFMLWQNDKTIVVGKHQDTGAEVDRAFVEQNGLHVVRRLSGGGAVYHDLGNLCFTFVEDAKDKARLDFAHFCRPVVRALAALGVEAQVSGRNDITIAGRKFSGNSQYIKNGRVLHHGTILWNSDLGVVAKALAPSREKLQSKGVKSVRSRVANVCDFLPGPLPLEHFTHALLEEMERQEPLQNYRLTKSDLAAIAEIQAARYDTWEWNWGRSPAASVVKSRRVEGCGAVSLHLQLKGERIQGLAATGDFFGNGEIGELAERLQGCPLTRQGLEKALAGVDVGHWFSGLDAEQLMDILLQ